MTGPCTRPECGSEVHTDGWGNPTRCPHEPVDPNRRCPRCDCSVGHTQCEHCKVCPHADGPAPAPEYAVALYEDGTGTLIVGIHPDGQFDYGPSYEPDAAAREFWDAVTRAARSASPWEAP
ncbi:hypothetical protein [Streptomyces sp. N35]|uniref:hypothetical protein n=1 Tax=Streptomyces sp. N35 TaxID=2795730 RepID=UPI0018F3BE15|nr:hypothetical protein [Streptomyces sp. N35]